MRRKAGIVLCSLLLGAAAAGCMTISETFGKEAEVQTQPAETVAWWSLTYEVPNPDRLPVEVKFQWLKGLE